MSPHEAALARQLRPKAEVTHLLNAFGSDSHATTRAVTESPRGPLRIVTVGRVAPQKDPEMFVEVLSKLRCSGEVEATWVGDGAGRARDQLERAGWR